MKTPQDKSMKWYLLAIPGTLCIIVSCVVMFGLVETLVTLVALSLVVAPAVIRARHKTNTMGEYQSQCEHHFIGDTCQECGYCYNDKK